MHTATHTKEQAVEGRRRASGARLHALRGRDKALGQGKPRASDLSGTQPIVSDMVKTIAGVGHRFHSQRWPAPYMADVRSLEQATTALRAEIARYPSLNARDVNSWGAKAQDDLEAFGHAGDVLSADLGLN